MTQLTNVLIDVQRNQQRVAAAQPPGAPEYPADPNFNWTLLRTLAETRFPMPGLGSVQHIAADLLSWLPTMAASDQHDASFVLAMASDWPDLDDDMRNLVFQRLNLYAIVANYGWPTAIQASAAVSAAPSLLLLPPGVQPVRRDNRGQDQRAQPQGCQRGGQRVQRQRDAPNPAPVPAPAPARARCGRR